MVSFARINPAPLTTYDRPAAGRDRVLGQFTEPPRPSPSSRPRRPPGQVEEIGIVSPDNTDPPRPSPSSRPRRPPGQVEEIGIVSPDNPVKVMSIATETTTDRPQITQIAQRGKTRISSRLFFGAYLGAFAALREPCLVVLPFTRIRGPVQ